jgi:membrane protease YdiL (CAAX protease family)
MSIAYISFVVITLLLAVAISYMAILSARILPTLNLKENLLLLPAENVARLGVIGVCVGLGLVSGLSPAELGWQLSQWPQKVAWGLIVGLGLGVGFYTITQLVLRYSGQRFYSLLLLDYIVPENNKKLAQVALAMGPVVLLEELLFRSLLLAGLAPLLPIEVLLVGGSVWFGLLHWPQGLWGVCGAWLAGFLLGMVFLWQNSLITPVVAHYVINMLQIWRVYLQRTFRSDADAI